MNEKNQKLLTSSIYSAKLQFNVPSFLGLFKVPNYPKLNRSLLSAYRIKIKIDK